MNEKELKSAYAQAVHFGHSLANLPFETVKRLADAPEALREAVRKTQEGDLYDYPDNRLPVLLHTTGTGNTRVRIDSEGRFTVERFISGRKVATAREGRPTLGTVTAQKQAAEAHLHGLMEARVRVGG